MTDATSIDARAHWALAEVDRVAGLPGIRAGNTSGDSISADVADPTPSEP